MYMQQVGLHHAGPAGPLVRGRVVAAAQAGRAAGTPRFGQTSGPNGFRTLPVLKVPLGPSPNDPSMPLELQMEVMTPEGMLALHCNPCDNSLARCTRSHAAGTRQGRYMYHSLS